MAGLRKKGHTILAGGGSAALLRAGNGRSWRPAGGRGSTKTRFSNYSVRAFCTAGAGALLPMPADSTDSDEFIGFLGMIRRAHGKAAMTLDDASCKSERAGSRRR